MASDEDLGNLRKLLLECSANLEEADADLEVFSYVVSHDLRAPIRAITMFSEILARKHASELSDEAQRLLQFVNRGAQEIDCQIEALHRLLRVSRQPVSKSQVDMDAVARQVSLPLVQEHARRKIDIHIEVLPAAWGDDSLLQQVFANLLSNAFKFTQKREMAKIEVGSRTENGELVYFIRDNGAGFDMKYSKNLFGVFRRLHRPDEFEGLGMGLAIVHRIVKRHGGRVWAESEEDRGASFYFTLPPAEAGSSIITTTEKGFTQ